MVDEYIVGVRIKAITRLILRVLALRYGGRRNRGWMHSSLVQVSNLLPSSQDWTDADIICLMAGTGGTIAGTGRYMKSMNEDVRVVLADPEGSGLYNKVNSRQDRPETT